MRSSTVSIFTMDVTALLNSSSAAALQRRDSVGSSTPSATGDTTATSTAVPTPERTPPRRTSGSRSPNRNRTPWDAGGYSLPLTLDTKSIPSFKSSAPHPTLFQSSDSPTEARPICSVSPKSPKHKFSDSRSSNSSSYTSSSAASLSHSRISSLSTSLSTVSEFQPLTALTADISLDGSGFPPKPLNSAAFHRQRPSLVASLDAAPIHHDRDHFTSPSPNMDPPMDPPADPPNVGSSPERPDSPSDAVMIRRGQDGTNSTNGTSGAPALNATNSIPELIAPVPETRANQFAYLSPEAPSSRTHKRAVSAPDSLAPGASDDDGDQGSAQDPPADTLADRLATRGLLPANYSYMFPWLAPEFIDFLQQYEDSRPEIEEMITAMAEPCMHPGSPCKLNSQPRKAISHLFGRNKLCTRSVPSHVWVHYCRKHYQRCRYRNSADFSMKQAKLVMDTIFRVQVWSDMNQRQAEMDEREGRPPAASQSTLIDWSLSTRKREQKRMEDQKDQRGSKAEPLLNANKKRQRRDEEDDSDADSDDPNGDPNFDQDLAVNGWLLAACRSGYSTTEMMEIAHRIYDELHSQPQQRHKMPDIEILPNILVRDKGDSKPKAPLKRKTSAAHKRSQSMGVNMHSQRLCDGGHMTRRVSQPNAGSWPGDYEPPAEKRQRRGEVADGYPAPFPPRSVERTVPMPAAPLQPRPGAKNVWASNSVYGGGEWPLPAPTSQGPTAAINHLPGTFDQDGGREARYQDRRISTHHRSLSDASAFQNMPQQAYRPHASSDQSSAMVPAPYGSSGGFEITPRPAYPVPATSTYTQGGMPASRPFPTLFPDFEQGQGHFTGPGGHFAGYGSYGSGSGGAMAGAQFGGAKHTRHQSTPLAPLQTERQLVAPTPLRVPPQQGYTAQVGNPMYRRQSYNGNPPSYVPPPYYGAAAPYDGASTYGSAPTYSNPPPLSGSSLGPTLPALHSARNSGLAAYPQREQLTYPERQQLGYQERQQLAYTERQHLAYQPSESDMPREDEAGGPSSPKDNSYANSPNTNGYESRH